MKLTEKFLKDLLEKGLIMEKMVYQGTPSSGAVYLPKALVGKAVRLILIPLDDDEATITRIKGKHLKISVDAYEYKKLQKEIKEMREKISNLDRPMTSMKPVESSEITQSEPSPIEVPKEVEEDRFNIDLSPRKENG